MNTSFQSDHELVETLNTHFTGHSVMDCPNSELAGIIEPWLAKLDDLIQESGEIDHEYHPEFVDLYCELKILYFQLKAGILLSIRIRNELRMTLKHANKLAGCFEYEKYCPQPIFNS